MRAGYQNIFLSLLTMLLLQASRVPTFKEPSLAEQLASYPKSAALSSHISAHSNGDWHLKQNHLLYATYFLQSPKMAITLTVDRQGSVRWWREVYDWAIQGIRDSILETKQLRDLETLLTQLPAPKNRSSLETLMLISYQTEGKWKTRLYDKTELPESVQKIYDLTSVPIRYFDNHRTTRSPGGAVRRSVVDVHTAPPGERVVGQLRYDKLIF